MSKERIIELQTTVFNDSHVSLKALEAVYNREYKKDFPFDNWLHGVIASAFSAGIDYTMEIIDERKKEYSHKQN